ncbi:MAG: C40 family peptidase [Thermomicrobiales bacterium]
MRMVHPSSVLDTDDQRSSSRIDLSVLSGQRLGRRAALALLGASGVSLAVGSGPIAAQEAPATDDPASDQSDVDQEPAADAGEWSDPTLEEAPATSGSGQAIADFAMQFLGDAYVYAGNQPGGFDCSGFTQYVVLNTLGIDIGHGTAGQTGYGAFVDWGAWLPGDLIFFADTFDAGISHVGISLGGGDMIHAENESTGVTISSVYSDYYSAHYYGAYRL